MILLNPKQHRRPYPDARSAEVMRATIGFFEAKGKEKLLADYYSRVWYADFLEFVKANRIFATMCTPAGEGAAGRALGHLAHLRVRRDPRLLRPAVLVHVAGLGARARPALDEQERGDPAAHGPGARGRRHLRLRPLREDPRRRHLLDRHGAHARRRRLAGQRPQVLHRQRQRGRDRLDLRPHRRQRRVRLLRRRPASRALPPDQERGREPELRLRVRAARLSGRRRATSCTAAATPGTPRSTPSTSASTTSAGRRSASAPTPSTRRSRTPAIASSTRCTSPTSRTCGRTSWTPTAGWSR